MSDTTRSYGIRGASKRFGSTLALSGVDFQLRPGRVTALLGENGSGKSTLVKLMSGVISPTEGHVERDGRRIEVGGPRDAQSRGLAVVYQDSQVFPELDVTTNLLGPRRLERNGLGMLRPKRSRARALKLLADLSLDIDPDGPARDLGAADRKLLEIGAALGKSPDYLLLDEPTALLDGRDSKRLLEMIDRLRSQGTGIGFITHRLDEALGVADDIVILRDGRKVAEGPGSEFDSELVVEAIVGRSAADREEQAEEQHRGAGEVLVELKGARVTSGSAPFDLAVHEGEILGLTGLVGSGAMETARMLSGRQKLSGRLHVAGQKVDISSPRHAIAVGIGYMPEERAELGLVTGMSIAENVSMADLGAISPGGMLRRDRMRRRANEMIDQLGIRAAGTDAAVSTLSGGNQQKVHIGKWVAAAPRILVVESPTHAVDVGAKAEIRRLLRSYVDDGGTVIVASCDVPEVVGFTDRVVVFRHGAVAGELKPSLGEVHGQALLTGVGDSAVDRIESLIEE